eukprot:CFRG5481T1
MDTLFTRANNVGAYAVSVLATMLVACWVSSVLFLPFNEPVFRLKVQDIEVTRGHEARGMRTMSEKASFKVDLDVDVTNSFNWDVKEVFLYLYADYETKRNVRNKVVVWDRIVLKKDKHRHKFSTKGMELKYPLFDDGRFFTGNTNVTLYMGWNIITLAGPLPLHATPIQELPMPVQGVSK